MAIYHSTLPGYPANLGNTMQNTVMGVGQGVYQPNPKIVPSLADIDYEHLLKQAQMTQRTLPDWAWKYPHTGQELSLIGLLYMRCQRFALQNTTGIATKAKFIIGPIQFIDAFEVEKEGEPHVAVVTLVGKEMLILHDADPLFPSDSLIAKIATLQK